MEKRGNSGGMEWRWDDWMILYGESKHTKGGGERKRERKDKTHTH